MSNTGSSTPALLVDRLTKRFQHGNEIIEAVSEVSLRVEKGDFVAVMGPSGSGKSTLLNVVAGLTAPTEGEVRVGGLNLFDMGDHERTLFRREHIGLVFQSFNLIPSLTGEENISLPLLLGGERVEPRRMAMLIERLGLERVRSRRPDSMSGGEQQRVAIGRALVTAPSLILADEPTGSLDSANGRKLCESFARLCAEDGAAVLMVTHNPAVAFFAERTVVLHDGRVAHECRAKDYRSVQEFAGDCLAHSEGSEERVW